MITPSLTTAFAERRSVDFCRAMLVAVPGPCRFSAAAVAAGCAARRHASLLTEFDSKKVTQNLQRAGLRGAGHLLGQRHPQALVLHLAIAVHASARSQ